MKDKIIKLGLFTSILTSSLLAEVEIQNIGLREGSLKYETSLFNRKLQITPGCKSIQDIFDEIDKTTGYNIINKTNIDVEAPICSAYKFTILGDVLNAIIADMDVVYYEEGNQRISLEYSQEYSVKLPMNWDIEDTKNIIKTKFPNIKTYTFGQTIRMVGNSKEMVKAKEALDRIEEWAQRQIPVNITITKLNTSYAENKDMIISRIDKSVFDKMHKVTITHGITYPLEDIGSILFDLQKNRVILNGNKYIKLEEMNNYSFFKNGYQISFDTNFGITIN